MSELKLKLQDKVQAYQRNKEIIKEHQAENKMLMAEIQDLLAEIGQEEVDVSLADGSEYTVKWSRSIREVLNKEGLANEIGVPKDELKTPFDYSMFTKKGKLEPKQITEHMVNKTSSKVRIGKKKKPRKSRRK